MENQEPLLGNTDLLESKLLTAITEKGEILTSRMQLRKAMDTATDNVGVITFSVQGLHQGEDVLVTEYEEYYARGDFRTLAYVDRVLFYMKDNIQEEFKVLIKDFDRDDYREEIAELKELFNGKSCRQKLDFLKRLCVREQ